MMSVEQFPQKGPPRPLAIPVVAPKTVAIVAMGKSCDQYVYEATNKGGKGAVADEIWAIGNQGGVLLCDRIFMMNDLDRAYKFAQERNVENVMESFKWLRTCQTPVYVSKAHPEFPSTVDYPLEEVIRHLKFGYLNGSVAYAIGFANLIGVRHLKFYGCDYTYPDNHVAEKGRACVEFWLMKWLLEGKTVELAHDTSLLDNNVPLGQKFYGYSDDVRAEVVDGETRIVRRPLMPDAAD